ncbi:MAG: hypothetical protein LC789_14965 [Actinobacteria bacterium]|nr:hypothetical protein [Actinomycetota bacterium]
MIRKLSALALLLPLTTAGLVVGAAPAFAAGSITDPVDGATFGADTTIAIRASYSTTDRTELRLKSPAGAEQVVKAFSGGTLTAQSGTLDYALDTSCATYPSPSCSGRAPALNGIWGVRLVGGAVDSSTFVLRIPPRVPASFTAQPDGYRAVVLSWRKGDEPDLVGWTLYEGGGVAVPSVGLDACNGTSCATTVTYASDGTGSHQYALVARRSAAPGSDETLTSERAEAAATLESPPPTSGGTTGGTSGTIGSGPTSSGITTSSKPAAAIAQRRAFALTFKAFGPKLGIPKLPPLPAAQPAVAPLPDGTYEKTLGYKPVTKTEKVSVPQAAATRVTGAVGSALDSDHFLRSLAGALVLLLAAAHLRRWLGSHTEQ